MPYFWCAAPYNWLFVAINLCTLGLGLMVDLPADEAPWSATLVVGPLMVSVGPAVRDEANEILGH